MQPGQGPRSAPVPPQGAPDGSGRLGTPRERRAHRVPSHCLGCSSEPPPKSPISPPLTVSGGAAVQEFVSRRVRADERLAQGRHAARAVRPTKCRVRGRVRVKVRVQGRHAARAVRPTEYSRSKYSHGWEKALLTTYYSLLTAHYLLGGRRSCSPSSRAPPCPPSEGGRRDVL